MIVDAAFVRGGNCYVCKKNICGWLAGNRWSWSWSDHAPTAIPTCILCMCSRWKQPDQMTLAIRIYRVSEVWLKCKCNSRFPLRFREKSPRSLTIARQSSNKRHNTVHGLILACNNTSKTRPPFIAMTFIISCAFVDILEKRYNLNLFPKSPPLFRQCMRVLLPPGWRPACFRRGRTKIKIGSDDATRKAPDEIPSISVTAHAVALCKKINSTFDQFVRRMRVILNSARMLLPIFIMDYLRFNRPTFIFILVRDSHCRTSAYQQHKPFLPYLTRKSKTQQNVDWIDCLFSNTFIWVSIPYTASH